MKIFLLVSILLLKFISSQPDLTLDELEMRQSVYIREEIYNEDDCEINECLMHLRNLGGTFPKVRKLLRFDTRAANIGDEPFHLDTPNLNNPSFVWDQCHQHWHFENFAEYKVYTQLDYDLNIFSNNQVPETGKRAFCLMDSEPTPLYNGPSDLQPDIAEYHCRYQGISVGWQDIYGSNLDCQFVDITDLSPGNYVLVVTLNPTLSLLEENISNNQASIPFEILENGGPTLPENCITHGLSHWLGDGYCDDLFNTEDCKYDYGDCCKDCCRNQLYECGSNGYNCLNPNCEETDF